MLTKLSVKKPFTIFVAVIIAVVFGGVAVYKLTPELFPNIDTPYAMVMTTYPGASAEEAEMEITKPLEQQLATLSNIKNVTSISSDNYSMVSLEFTDDVNMDAISVDIRDKIDQIDGNFPDAASAPVVMKVDMTMMPTVVSAIGMENKTTAEVSSFVKENIQSELEGIEGVASVSTVGMVDEGIQIVLSKDKINDVNDEIADAIKAKFNKGENKIKKGIKKAKNGQKKIKKGKNQISDGAEDANATISQLQESKKGLLQLKKEGPKLVEAYQAAVASGIQEYIDQAEAAIESLGFSSVEELQQQIDNCDESIEAINDAVDSIEAGLNAGVIAYADLAATDSLITNTVEKLQETLSEIESQKDAAVDSADMTGVITMDNVSAILSAQNFSMPAGYVTDGEAEILVSVGDKIKDVDELQDLILFDLDIDDVDPIRLSDIATVSNVADDSEIYAKINGENGVLVSLTKQSTYATATVSDNIHDKFEKLEKANKGLKFTDMMDQGLYIHVVINSVLKDLILGAIFAILILLFFLRDIRPTVITAVSIPVSVITAIALMYFTGVTMNLISLSGLAIGVGMLVDNSIVVIENIYRLRSMGYSAVQAAFSGAQQVAGAITASTLTTICVFVPIVFVDGMTRQLFTDLALTVAYSLIASLIIALTFVPAIAKGLLVKKTGKTVLGQGGRVIATYKRFVGWTLLHKKRLVLAALVLLLASTSVVLTRGFEFMPAMSTSQISASITMPEGSTLEDTTKVNDDISNEIRKIDGVDSVGVMLASGMAEMFGIQSDNVTDTTMYIILDEDKVEQAQVVADRMEQLAEKHNCEIITSADMDLTALITGSGVSMDLYCDDIDTLRITGGNIEKNLREMKKFEEVSDIQDNSTEEIKIVVNKNTAMKNGLTVAQVFQQVNAKLTKDKTATTLTQKGETIDINVENTTGDNFTREDLEKMKLTVDKQDGTKEKVKLSKISDIQDDASLNVINHRNQQRTLQVTASLNDGYNITKVTADVKKLVKDKNLIPAEVKVDYGGENEEIMHSMKQMLLMMCIGMLLVYLIMVAQFQSLRSPFIIIFTLPLAFTGGMLALLVTNQILSVIGMMGFVMLVGIVVNNGIVLVDCINRFRLEGMEMNQAIIEAGAVRMRPVIMTAATTILGLLPLALGFGQGAEMVQPVAIICIGGLAYATITTLFIIPIMYRWLSRKHMEKIKDEDLEIVSV